MHIAAVLDNLWKNVRLSFFRDTFWTLPLSWMCGTCCLSAAKLTRTLSLIFWSPSIYLAGCNFSKRTCRTGSFIFNPPAQEGPVKFQWKHSHWTSCLKKITHLHISACAAESMWWGYVLGVIRRIDIKDPSATFPYQSHRLQATSAELF